MKNHARSSDKAPAKQKTADPKSAGAERPQSRDARNAVLQRAAADPNSLGPRDLLRLQRTIGNRAVTQLLSRARPEPEAAAKENRTGMPDGLKSGVERLSGVSLDDVRVFYNSPAPARLRALAYTRGAEIHVAPGQESHLPHEAWHVVQQKRGRVRPTLRAGAELINDDRGLEREADLMGGKALSAGRSASEPAGAGADTVQRMAAAPAAYATAQAGAPVVQMATHIQFGHRITGNDKITAMQHTRGPVHGTAVNWVFDNGAWSSVPDGEVCNHSRGYDKKIAQPILDLIQDETLSRAASLVKDTYEELQSKGNGLGAATSTHSNRMDSVINSPNKAVNVDNINDTFNYYLYKIGDYPANLFFWPDRTGAEPDQPKGAYGEDNAPDADWKVNNSLISNKVRLAREKKRLDDARDDLENALK